MTRSRLGLLASLLCAPMLLAAQNPPPPPADTGNITLIDVTLHPGEYEPHTIFLQKGLVYRISFSGPGVDVRVRSYQGKQLPFVVPLTNEIDASGTSEYELYPQSDGDIEITEVFNALKVPVTFRLWRDARATERGRRSADEGFWELGVDGLAGWHGDFKADSSTAGGGATIGGCLAVRNGPGPLGFLNGCIFGVERLASSTSSGFFLFTEPEIRLSNRRRTDSGWKFEWGLLVRYASFGSDNDGGNLGGGNFGFGAYLARDQRDLNGNGWRVTLTGRFDGLSNEKLDGFGNTLSTKHLWAPALQLGVGRYH
jgi:hypothetical protein